MKRPARTTARGCPICGRPSADAYRPFCSERCAEVDLGRWLRGVYGIPADDEDLPDGAVEDSDDER